jgi:predicted alpha/beta-hydrolase family hydrolase
VQGCEEGQKGRGLGYKVDQRERERETLITCDGEGQKRGANTVERLREAKATTVRKVRLALMRHAERNVSYGVGRRPKKIVKQGEKLREAKATTLRRVRLVRSCAIGGEGRGGRG